MSFTVTATVSGSAPDNGIALLVRVLTSATEAGGKTGGGGAATTSLTSSITPNGSNSLIVFVGYDNGGARSFTAASSNTLDYNPVVGGAGGFGHYTGTVTSGTPVTVGETVAASDNCEWAIYEVLASGGSTPLIDGSSPAGANNGTKTVTSAAFTPPPGSVLVAMVTADGNGSSGTFAWSVTDTSGLGLVWTLRGVIEAFNFGGTAAIYTTTVPSVPWAPPRPVPAAAQPLAPWTQRPYVSDPNLIPGGGAPADPLQLNPEQSDSSDLWRVAAAPAFYDRRLMPQQRAYYDLTLLAAAQLENELLGGAGTTQRYNLPATHADRREVPQQRAYISDPALLTTAELEDELLGGAETPKYYRTPATHADRREVPQQRIYESDPLLLTAAELENELLGGADTGRHWLPAAFADRREYPYQPKRDAYTPGLLDTAELENELLGGAQTPRTYGTPATHYARWWMPEQPARLADPLLIATALLENELLGGAETLLRYITSAYIDRREVPQQRLYLSDPSFYPAPNPPDITLSGWLPRWLASNTPATHADRREVPQQRAYPGQLTTPVATTGSAVTEAWWGIDTDAFYHAQKLLVSDPSFFAPPPQLDPTLAGWPRTLAAYNTPATHADRRKYPQQRAYISDPSFYPPPGTPGTGSDVTEAWWGIDTDAFWRYQKTLVSDPSFYIPPPTADPTLAGWPRQWLTLSLAATHADRRLVPQQRPYISDPSFYPAQPIQVQVGSGTTEAWWGADTEVFYGYQKLLVSDPSFYPHAVPVTGSAVTEAWWGADTDAFYKYQRNLISDPSFYPAVASAGLFQIVIGFAVPGGALAIPLDVPVLSLAGTVTEAEVATQLQAVLPAPQVTVTGTVPWHAQANLALPAVLTVSLTAAVPNHAYFTVTLPRPGTVFPTTLTHVHSGTFALVLNVPPP